ncbi:hypothetical protein, partial [Thalassobius sp. I31.1]|uniref:hypothetical protein n=1 Tax=Thalassobius sp. I31.1 TaxID=2109912 RepID=UPI001E344FCB
MASDHGWHSIVCSVQKKIAAGPGQANRLKPDWFARSTIPNMQQNVHGPAYMMNQRQAESHCRAQSAYS